MVDHAEHGDDLEWLLSSAVFFHRGTASNDFGDKSGGSHQDRFCNRAAHATRRNPRPKPEPVDRKYLDRWGHHDAAGGSIGAVYSVNPRNSEHRRDMVGDTQRRDCVERILYRAGGRFVAGDCRTHCRQHG
jgi:hypothetical protein